MSLEEETALLARTIAAEPHRLGGRAVEAWTAEGFGLTVRGGLWLLTAGDVLIWHRRPGLSTWSYNGGGPVAVSLSPDGEEVSGVHLGTDMLLGQRPQIVVPGETWLTMESLGAWSLIGWTDGPAAVEDEIEVAPPAWFPGTGV